MATVIIRTIAGAAHDKAVREGAAAASPYKYIHLLDGAPVTDIAEISSLDTVIPSLISHTFTRHSDEDSDFPLTEAGVTWSRFEPHLPETVECQINAIAIVLENGVLWGYAPYLTQLGGLTKTPAFSWTLDLLIVESTDAATALQLTYSPIDYRSMRDRLITDIRNELNIEELLGMLQDATKFCLIDGNETSTWVLDGGEPDPLCQILPTTTTLPPIDGGIE